MSPLATLVITAPVGKYSTVSLLIKFIVSLVAGQQIDKTSDTENKLFKLTIPWRKILYQRQVQIPPDTHK